jgi:hypothetical protein
MDVVLWTIQHEKAFENMCATGMLRADCDHLLFEGLFIESYRWMAEQMTKRIGAPPANVEFPVWAWYQWEGKRKRLDMRTHGKWGEKGTPIVLLTVDVPDEKVLLSDFDYWHCILSDIDIIFPYSDTACYSEEEKRKSWENIFDISCSFAGEDRTSLSTQATVWEIKEEWVKKVEHFISR